jgi:hypothetical protein
MKISGVADRYRGFSLEPIAAAALPQCTNFGDQLLGHAFPSQRGGLKHFPLSSCRLATVLVVGRTGFELLNIRLIRQPFFERTPSLRALSIGSTMLNRESHGPLLFRFIAAVFLPPLLVIWHGAPFSDSM